jgi:hypothetical protein
MTVVDVDGVNATAVDVAFRSLFLIVGGAFSYNGVSPESPPVTLIVGGSWGVPSPPRLVVVTAMDTGHNVGLCTGDSLVLLFDQAVRQLDVWSPHALDHLLTFRPPLPAGVELAGAWTSPMVLSVYISVAAPGCVIDDWTPWNVGSLVVSIRSSADLTSANRESQASNSSSVVQGGTWGDAPGIALSPRNASAVVVTLRAPVSAVGVAVTTYFVQWSTSAAFTGVSPVPNATAVARAWAELGAQSTAAVDDAGRIVADVVLVSSGGAGFAVDTAVVSLPGVLGLSAFLRFDLGRLLTSVIYYFRGSCNGPGGVMGPVVRSDPASISPQPPLVLSVLSASVFLPTPGGMTMEATGEWLGAAGSAVFMTLSGEQFGPFVSGACEVISFGSRVRCVSPQGVGSNLLLSISVDGIVSPPLANRTLSYAPPSITNLHVISGAGDDGVPTTGGAVVVLEGRNFGPSSLERLSLGTVTYSSLALSLALGKVVEFATHSCAITRSHTQITCGMATGVGKNLHWDFSIAGQAATTPTTSYRAPLVEAMGILSADGGTIVGPEALRSLQTQGGEWLVRCLNLLCLALTCRHICATL